MRDGPEAQGLRDDLDVIALDVADDEDLGFGQIVQREVGGGVAEDRLLDQEDVDPRGADLLDETVDFFCIQGNGGVRIGGKFFFPFDAR